LDTVRRRTRGEVWARLVARSIRLEEDARAASWVSPMLASDTDSRANELDRPTAEPDRREATAISAELEASVISELLMALLLRLVSEEEKDFFWTDEDVAIMVEDDAASALREEDDAATIAEDADWLAEEETACVDDDPSIKVICLALRLFASTTWASIAA
jgi:hypothetical protein